MDAEGSKMHLGVVGRGIEIGTLLEILAAYVRVVKL